MSGRLGDYQAKLGDRARCRVTGFTGIVTYISHWLNGCVRVGLQPEKLGEGGKVQDMQQFDAEQLELVKEQVHEPLIQKPTLAPPAPRPRTGGPKIAIRRW